MLLYAGRRLTYGLLVLALVATLVFLIIRLIPGDAVRLQLADAPGVTQAQIDQRERYEQPGANPSHHRLSPTAVPL